VGPAAQRLQPWRAPALLPPQVLERTWTLRGATAQGRRNKKNGLGRRWPHAHSTIIATSEGDREPREPAREVVTLWCALPRPVHLGVSPIHHSLDLVVEDGGGGGGANEARTQP
jgi:hypothetical protein